MEFRIAVEKDFPQLAQLRWDFRQEDGVEKPIVSYNEFIDTCIEFLRHGLLTGYQTYWIAEENGTIISQIFVHRIDLIPRPCKLKDQFGYITNNYTRPNHRNRGIGSDLIRYVTQWANEQDMELLIVYPSDEAIPYYERAGFRAENDVMELKLREY